MRAKEVTLLFIMVMLFSSKSFLKIYIRPLQPMKLGSYVKWFIVIIKKMTINDKYTY